MLKKRPLCERKKPEELCWSAITHRRELLGVWRQCLPLELPEVPPFGWSTEDQTPLGSSKRHCTNHNNKQTGRHYNNNNNIGPLFFEREIEKLLFILFKGTAAVLELDYGRTIKRYRKKLELIIAASKHCQKSVVFATCKKV